MCTTKISPLAPTWTHQGFLRCWRLFQALLGYGKGLQSCRFSPAQELEMWFWRHPFQMLLQISDRQSRNLWIFGALVCTQTLSADSVPPLAISDSQHLAGSIFECNLPDTACYTETAHGRSLTPHLPAETGFHCNACSVSWPELLIKPRIPPL